MNEPSDSSAGRLTASQWRQIVDSATDTGIISTDPEGRVTSWNEGAVRLFGWSEAEMVGQSLERIFPEDGREGRLAKEMADAISQGRGGGEEGWRQRKDGSLMWATGELTPIRADDARVVGFIKIARDRTRRRQAEEALLAERQILTILNRAGSALAVESDLSSVRSFTTS